MLPLQTNRYAHQSVHLVCQEEDYGCRHKYLSYSFHPSHIYLNPDTVAVPSMYQIIQR
jgi:hypothetical protein